jgi:hypothetical protein
MNGDAFLKQLLGRNKATLMQGKVDDVRVQPQPVVIERPVLVQQAAMPITVPDGMVKDFDTGEIVARYTYHKETKSCAGCGKPGAYHDHKYGWRVCIECDSEDIAANVTREATAIGF